MITDKIEQLSKYTFKGCEIVEAFLHEHVLESLTENRYELAEGIFVMVQQCAPRENCSFEGHRKYTDVQVVFAGDERILWAGLNDGRCIEEYSETKDVAFYQVDATAVTDIHLLEGMFAVFAPQDLHAPLNPLTSGDICKLVFKIPVAEYI